jgi:hypothetical protein
MGLSKEPSEQVDRLAYTPAAAALVSGRPRTRIFDALRRGELVARKDGKATLIEHEELVRWIKSFPIRPSEKTVQPDAQPGARA